MKLKQLEAHVEDAKRLRTRIHHLEARIEDVRGLGENVRVDAIIWTMTVSLSKGQAIALLAQQAQASRVEFNELAAALGVEGLDDA